MKNQDLIERAQRWGHKCDPKCVTEAEQLIDEFIAALSPVLPQEVEVTVMYLHDEAKEMADADMHRNAKAMRDTADLIERLALSLEASQKHCIDRQKTIDLAAHRELQMQQRIKELHNDCKMWARQRNDEMLKATACEAQIAELQQRIEKLFESNTELMQEIKWQDAAELESCKAKIAEYEKARQGIVNALQGVEVTYFIDDAIDTQDLIAAIEYLRGMK